MTGPESLIAHWNQLRRATLWLLVASLVAGAILGVYAILVGDFGATELKILSTTFAIAFFSVTALGCAIPLERARAHAVPVAGLCASAAGFLLWLVIIWADGAHSEEWYKAASIAGIWAFSAAHSGLLALAQLRGSEAWISWAENTVIATFAAVLTVLVVGEQWGEGAIRLLGILAILDGCGTIVIPVLHRLARGEIAAEGFVRLICPRCGHRAHIKLGGDACPSCNALISVEVEPGQSRNSAV
jgi:hypothetical protein